MNPPIEFLCGFSEGGEQGELGPIRGEHIGAVVAAVDDVIDSTLELESNLTRHDSGN